jgi:ABC-type polysaccharide/polyol phosphate transport system ATPase subunit
VPEPVRDELAWEDEDVAVRLQDVSILYRVPRERIVSFKEYAIRRIQRRVVYEDFWALRDVTLALRRGESVGIVGRNGAGKSTLLRVVSRVLQPIKGRVRVVGRLAPLLEIGAGFHPELTGRENVFLNATLLGHSHRETEAKFDEIVDFAELGDFIDAPLRTYSAGMQARLGFGVATAWRPDVLLMDEVMAVGDEGFRAKSQERIDRFRESGATVLVVGHNLPLIAGTCERALWLHHGCTMAYGPAPEVVELYRSRADEP